MKRFGYYWLSILGLGTFILALTLNLSNSTSNGGKMYVEVKAESDYDPARSNCRQNMKVTEHRQYCGVYAGYRSWTDYELDCLYGYSLDECRRGKWRDGVDCSGVGDSWGFTQLHLVCPIYEYIPPQPPIQ